MSARSILLALLILALPSTAAAASSTSSTSSEAWSWPLDGQAVSARFDPPATDYGAGHRGVDLAAQVGAAVRAVAAGQVTFAGPVGGVPVVTIDHGGERSTYQPVSADVRVGDAVGARDVIGTLLGSPSHCAGACLHLGRLAGEAYLDPLDLLGGGRFRLVSPDGPAPAPPGGLAGSLRRPVGGPVTSPFGMRVHPVTGVRKLHDGTDFGVPCGTPVHAAAAGVVTSGGHRGAYGLRVALRHTPALETTYNHLSSRAVSIGERVRVGDVIGLSGTSGLSTGCHLHFMVIQDGTPQPASGALSTF